jgi:hypothetical protein
MSEQEGKVDSSPEQKVSWLFENTVWETCPAQLDEALEQLEQARRARHQCHHPPAPRAGTVWHRR